MGAILYRFQCVFSCFWYHNFRRRCVHCISGSYLNRETLRLDNRYRRNKQYIYRHIHTNTKITINENSSVEWRESWNEKKRREKKRKIQCKLVVSHYRIYEISVQYHTIKHTHFPGGVFLSRSLRIVFTQCACVCCRCTARHTFCFVSFYCYEYWVLLDMLYVCWNTLIFETASLQFSHEYFKIENGIAMLCCVLSDGYTLICIRIFGAGSFSIEQWFG